MSRSSISQKPPRTDRRGLADKAKGTEIEWDHVALIFNLVEKFSIGETRYVYFIGEQDGGCVKIGVGKDPIARLRSMQTGNPRRLKIERVLLGDMEIEKLLHEMWEPYVVEVPGRQADGPLGTEWFKPEIREKLYPIVETAVDKQLEIIGDPERMTYNECERLVREAHGAHDHVAVKRHQKRIPAQGAGHLPDRRSRI